MIVAAGGDGGTDEDGVNEKRGRYFLKPEPGMADGSCNDVAGHRQGKAEAQHAAKKHQHEFELVERRPFQVMLPSQHQFVGDGHGLDSPSSRIKLSRRPGERRDPKSRALIVREGVDLRARSMGRGVWVQALAETTC